MNKILCASLILMSQAIMANSPFKENIHCKQKAQEILVNWGSKEEWRDKKTPSVPLAWASPTQEIGSWVYLTATPDRTVLKKLTQHTTLVAELTPPKCQATAIVPQFAKPVKANPTEEFSDSDLEKLINSHNSGFIYVWSPMMPLSVEGLQEFKQALKNSDHHLSVVADPNSSLKLLNPGKFPGLLPSEFRRVTSSELIFRDVQNHFPAILFYKNGKIHSMIKYGFEKASLYSKDIKNYESSLK